MGRASRKKRLRRTLQGLQPPTNLPPELRHAELRRTRGRPKISQSLTDLALPFLIPGMDAEDYRRLIAITAIAWNLSLEEDGSPAKALELVEDMGAAERREFEALLKELIARKRKLFPKDHRLVAGWEVVVRPDGSFLLTAAAMSTE